MRDEFSYARELFGPASVIYALRNVRKCSHNTRLKFHEYIRPNLRNAISNVIN